MSASGKRERGMGSSPEAVLDVGELLSIDVGAEVRKLAGAQLESDAQLPVELVRRALAAGAHRADVACRRRTIVVADDGAPIPSAALDALAAVLDRTAEAASRHRALLALEASGDLSLLALGGLDAALLRVRSGGRAVTLRRGERPRTDAAPGPGTTVELAGAALAADDVRAAVRRACRFAPDRVTVDGTAIAASRFGETLAEEILEQDRLRGHIAIPEGGDTAHIWVTLDGVLAAHLAMPGVPCFEAVVDARPFVPQGSPRPPAAMLREVVQPHVEALSARARILLEQVSRSIESLTPARQGRVRELVLAAVRKQREPGGMRAARVFRSLGSQGNGALLSVDDLDALGGTGPARALVSLFPEQESSRFVLPTGPVPVLDTIERGRLSSLLGISFRPPQPRRASSSVLSHARALLQSAFRFPRTALERLRHSFDGGPVPDVALLPGERELLEALRRQLMTDAFGNLDVLFVEGAGPVRRTARPRASLLLPRRNPTVAAAVSAIALDPAWVYAAALAFEALPRPAARSLFLRRD